MRQTRVQVTPILGMLALIHEDRLTSPSGKRYKVHFVWTTRNPNDFHLLDPTLIKEARCAEALGSGSGLRRV